MAAKAKEMRYVPALSLLLLLAIGAAGWLLFKLNIAPPVASAGSYEVTALIANANNASVLAHRALSGDDAAFVSLRQVDEKLNGLSTAGLSAAQRASLGDIRDAVGALVDGQGDVLALEAEVARIAALAPKFADAIYALQGELSIQRQPVVIAHLERLRLLGESLPVIAQGMLTGNPDATRLLLDNEMQLQQIVRSLQAGDPALGIVAIDEQQTQQAIASLARRARQLGEAVGAAQQLGARMPPIREASAELDALVLGLDTGADPSGIELSPSSAVPAVELLRVYALLAGSAFIVLLILILWFRTSKSRSKSQQQADQSENDQHAILQLLDELGNLADGDLTVQATVTEDVTGAIADSINFAIEAMRELVTTINEGAILVEDATKQTQASAKSLEAASEAQARQVKAASDAVHNMAASIDEISGNAERSSDVARHSVDIAHKGGDAVRRTIEGMNTIRETIQDTSKRIKRLGESSQEIGDIVELINDIADQTNILALNASIQASMAGEAGRGFAVVADEVQRLAERSANATKQIEVLVSTIQSDTNEAVVSMERSTTDVVGGALLAENAGAALEEIEQVSNQIASLVQNISSSSREQAEAAKTVLQIVAQLKKISGETDASAATTTNFISKLSALASQLRESVSGFVLPGGQPAAQSSASAAQDAAPQAVQQQGVKQGQQTFAG
jgi:twitching motility protein PilJ